MEICNNIGHDDNGDIFSGTMKRVSDRMQRVHSQPMISYELHGIDFEKEMSCAEKRRALTVFLETATIEQSNGKSNIVVTDVSYPIIEAIKVLT
jgi:hypothetical protein